MIYTTQRLLQLTRQLSNQNPNVRQMPADIEIMHLDNAHRELSERVLMVRPDLLATSFDLTLDGSLSYHIPDSIPFNYEQILMITELDSNSYEYPTEAFDWLDRMSVSPSPLSGVIIGTQPVSWEIRGNYIEFPSRPDDMTVRVWYTRFPVGFFYGACGNATVTSTTVELPDTLTAGEIVHTDDYYNGSRIYNGADGLVHTISDYVASTDVITVSAAWGTNPTASTTVIEIVSPLPERIHDVIAMIAARNIRVNNDDNIAQLETMIEKRLDEFLARFRKPQSQEPNRIRKVLRY